MIAAVAKEAADGSSSDEVGSCGRRCRGRRKLKSYPSVEEEVAVLSLDDERN